MPENFVADATLLIVPYGIETKLLLGQSILYNLLIVPYGIETLFELYTLKCFYLLIVPYGIETMICTRHTKLH